MTQLAKLYAAALNGRRLSLAEFCRLMEAFGYRLVRTKGSHRVFHHAASCDTRIVQPRGKDAKTYQIKQFLDTIEELGLQLED